jgi:hypothetical protein
MKKHNRGYFNFSVGQKPVVGDGGYARGYTLRLRKFWDVREAGFLPQNLILSRWR